LSTPPEPLDEEAPPARSPIDAPRADLFPEVCKVFPEVIPRPGVAFIDMTPRFPSFSHSLSLSF
jgi:hypothetical protein